MDSSTNSPPNADVVSHKLIPGHVDDLDAFVSRLVLAVAIFKGDEDYDDPENTCHSAKTPEELVEDVKTDVLWLVHVVFGETIAERLDGTVTEEEHAAANKRRAVRSKRGAGRSRRKTEKR